MTAPISPAPVSIRSARAVISDNATAVPHMNLLKACDGLQHAQYAFLRMFKAALNTPLVIVASMLIELS